MSVTIYHNPRCSKSRQTLQLLQERDEEITVVEYLKTPLDRAGLEQALTMLGEEDPRAMMRVKEAEYKEQGLGDAAVTREQLLDAMAATPKLMERPLVVKDGKAALGRPPEKVLEIL
ncbi:arsenate reductase (glutaredoxin) [Magnetofaba australis]|uniref:Arsenate reductase n=1 Tax=Magnetofaba australis IT-1 TaxID=1434232 RepID=A0A1Y2K2Z3_9PROT|nr:arsenate reductase (glutaredoxin) [Magnetofaba australis]OSM01534.1 putative arsenate reductase [Magnetofaba australis IT-1]